MKSKKLKYLVFLSLYPSFSTENYQEVEKDAFRWVHNPFSEEDFLPLNQIKTPPQRMLDESDNLHLGYGLSMFDSFENSFERYKKLYKKRRGNLKPLFIADKGDCIANLRLSKNDGIADEPNNLGHFTFYEYEGVNLEKSITDVICIFKEDGNFID